MNRNPSRLAIAALLLLAAAASAQGGAPIKKCAPDAVIAGAVCMDTYEASVWRVPNATTTNRSLVTRIQQGKVSALELTARGAVQLGVGTVDDYAPCADDGQACANDVYAVSLPGVRPSANLTWFQAQAACANSRKRLPTNVEWQTAVIGTPDAPPGEYPCITASSITFRTGSYPECRSARGAFDMVGNVYELVATWLPPSTDCGVWSPSVSPTNDDQCLLGAATTGEPGALVRGGGAISGPGAGPMAVASISPSFSHWFLGFRCAR